MYGKMTETDERMSKPENKQVKVSRQKTSFKKYVKVSHWPESTLRVATPSQL